MCCLIVYFLISCISIIYSFHIFLYSYDSSIHIISYIHIYFYSLSNLYPSIQFGTARNPVPTISNIQSQNLGTKLHSLFRPRKQPMPLHGFFIQSRENSLPCGVRRNSKILVPTRCSQCVDQLCLLVQLILTVRTP